MRKLFAASACVVLWGFLVLGTTFAQRPDTGDRKLDSLLGKINKEAKADPEGFLKQLSQKHDIPEEEVRKAKEHHGLEAGDIYMATALARRTRRPVWDIAAEYKQNQGRGWGVMAQGMGIKPGSPEFKELKEDAGRSVDQMKAMARSRKQQEQALEKQRGQKNQGESQGKGQGKGKKK